MYSSFHSSVGIGILALPLPLAIKIPLAIASHAAVDTLGEGWHVPWLPREIILHVWLLLVGLVTGNLPIVVGGILLANLFDIIDKGLLKKRFIHGSKWYPKVLIQFTIPTTKLLNLIAVSIMVIILTLI